MAKTKTAYVCTECGADYSKWQAVHWPCHLARIRPMERLGSAGMGSGLLVAF